MARTIAVWTLMALFLAVAAGPLAALAHADEGMWTLDNLPLAQIAERYGFTPTPQWVEHVQKASVRFGGGSGSFVTQDGLVLTNHHVALGQLQKVSSQEKDYVRDGFFARTRAEEMRCPDLELGVLLSFENVTDRVLAAVDAKAADREQNAQRKGAMARIEKESTQRTRLKSEVVELYRGDEYWLYRYKKYTDVRLVMAPEQQAAFYGGDPDNFTYPRHDLDIAFFRIYENGQPVRPEHWLRWSAAGAGDGELVFVSGHPGSTSRLKTVAQLEYERDLEVPARIAMQALRRQAYLDYAARGPEQARRAQDRIFGIENGLKRLRGFLEALNDPRLLEKKRAQEAELRARVGADPALAAASGGAWDRIAAAEREMARRQREYLYRGLSGAGRLAEIANQIVRYGTEVGKPNEKRFAEYRESALESLKFRLFSPAPIYPDLEEAILAAVLQEALDQLGPDDAFVKAPLGGRRPGEVAHEIVGGTKLADVAFRRQLVAGGRKAVEASSDPLVVWARRLDAPYRELRAWYEDNVESVASLEGRKIAQARFAVYGKSTYPDATGTLRLSYGKVAGYELGSTRVPYKTTFHGLYDRAASFDGRPPFDLPPMVRAQRGDVDLATPLDFVTTNDIVGGNSGSPVVNRAGEVVGVVFDGNIQAFVWDYAYTDEQARTVAVHSRGILEGLRKIYDMDALAGELESGTAK